MREMFYFRYLFVGRPYLFIIIKMSWLNMEASNAFNYNSQYSNNFFFSRVDDQSPDLLYPQHFHSSLFLHQNAINFTQVKHLSEASNNQFLETLSRNQKSEYQSQSDEWINKQNASRKGLKSLAFSLLKILKKSKPLTQTELVGSIERSLFKLNKQGGNKQEKNVKRRIYDALNVMISAGLLERQSSFIHFKSPITKTAFLDHSIPKFNELRSRIDKKKELFMRLSSKMQAIKCWIQKNKREANKLDNQTKKLYFPLIFVIKQGDSEVWMNLMEQWLLISNNGLQFLSETDLIQGMFDDYWLEQHY